MPPTPREQVLEAENIRLRDELRRAKAATDSSRLWQILDRSLNEIYLFDLTTLRFEYLNAGALKNLGYTLEQARELTPVDIKPELTEAAFRALINPLLTGAQEKLVFETVHQRADGSRYPVEVHLQLVPHEDTRVFLAVINDISERRRAARALKESEESLFQSQKLESIGRLAGGIAHDLNNVLTVILSYVALLERAPRDSPANLDDLREIREAALRSSELTRQLLAFARRQVISPKLESLNEIISGADRFWRRVLGEDVELSVHLGADPWPVRVDRSQVEQVILNLAVNARDAMPGGGKLTVETKNVVLGPKEVAQHPEMAAGPYVKLTVSDTGEGIAPEAVPHVFEPFFTTKPAGKGTGLGLSTTYGIVRQSGGHIWLRSTVGVGTTFEVYFPRAQEAAEPVVRPTSTPVPRAAGGRECILVVEDESVVRRVVVRTLQEAGYQVLVASRPEEALELAREAKLDLLLTDVVMPGMSGRELVARLLKTQPRLRVLYVSGYSEDHVAQGGVLEEGLEFLAKPFTPGRLQERVRQVLDAGR